MQRATCCVDLRLVLIPQARVSVLSSQGFLFKQGGMLNHGQLHQTLTFSTGLFDASSSHRSHQSPTSISQLGHFFSDTLSPAERPNPWRHPEAEDAILQVGVSRQPLQMDGWASTATDLDHLDLPVELHLTSVNTSSRSKPRIYARVGWDNGLMSPNPVPQLPPVWR